MIAPERRRRTLARALARLGIRLALTNVAIFAIAETPWGRRKLREELAHVLRDQLGLVALLGQVLQDPAHRVGDPVDLRKERLRDDQDPQRVRHGSHGRDGAATEAERPRNDT